MDNQAGVVAANATPIQEEGAISSQKNLDPQGKPNVNQDAKIEVKPEESDSSAKKDEKDDLSKKEKAEPYHKNPAFQRLIRNNKIQSAKMEVIEKKNQELINIVKEILATQKGEDYTPTSPEKTIPDPQELFDLEMDKVLEDEDLSSEDEEGMINVAKKYTYELGDGTKVYLPAKVALQIFRDMKGKESTPESEKKVEEEPPKKSTPSTRPSSSAKKEADISKVDELKSKPKNIYDAIARAKRLIEEG